MSERVHLKDKNELLFRQVLLGLSNGRPTWESFKGRREEDWQVSTDRSSIRSTPKAAYEFYTQGGARSNGVVATRVHDLSDLHVEAYEAPIKDDVELPDNPAHCQYDLANFDNGEKFSHGKREKVCTELYERARNASYPTYIPTN